MGQPLSRLRLFIYGYPLKTDEHGQAYVLFGFKLGDEIVTTTDGRVLIGPVQRISYN